MRFRFIKLKYIFIITLVHFSYSQDFSVWNKNEIKRANTAADVSYLSENERQVIMFMNLARINGKKFFKTYMQLYKKRFNQLYQVNGIKKGNTYWKSLKKDLYKTKKLTPFQPHEKLTIAARYHAKDMGSTGQVGHESTNGMSASERGEKFAGTPYVGENCSYGFEDPLFIVGQLLLDDDVPSLGHRKNILDEEYGYYAVGVAIEKHEEYRHNCVIDFAVKVKGLSESTTDVNENGLQNDTDWQSQYVYEAGQFFFDKQTNSWREETDAGVTFNFTETSRVNNQAILYDDSRTVWLRLDSAKKTCEYSENGSDWALLYYLSLK